MSFSSRVKQELTEKENEARHCNIAELSAILSCCGYFFKICGTIVLKIQSDNIFSCKKAERLIQKLFNITPPVSVSNKGGYTMFIGSESEARRILSASGLYSEYNGLALINKNIPPLIVSGSCCKRAYLRGAFVAAGSISNPEKTYHAEFIIESETIIAQLVTIINSFSLKLFLRNGSKVIYLKDSEQITDLLNVMEAHQSLLELANIRVVKDVRNDINRRVNFEAANLNKTISASLKQLDDIRYIKAQKGLSYLNDCLFEAAHLRLSHPDLSLKEIGEMLNPPVSKSGANHRFRKINEIAELIKNE